MDFGDIAIGDAEGAILAHSVRVEGLVLKKGQVLGADQVHQLRAAGVETIIGARLGADDVDEDSAAARLALALTGPNTRVAKAHTGRVNLFANADGVLRLDHGLIDRLNRLDEAITVATLEPHQPVEDGQMIATVKIIPLAAPADALAKCEAFIRDHGDGGTLSVSPYRPRTVGLIQTRVAGTKEKMLDKTRATTDQRLAAFGMHVRDERRCLHTVDSVLLEIQGLRAEGCDLLLLIGASAIIDRRDILPSAVVAAGGQIDRFGMPVDPGNLLMLARIGKSPVLGLPGCARSIKLNGFDWVLQRIAADIAVTPEDIAGMGVGGLLKEIPSRPQPREALAKTETRKIAAIILAAGQSRRMGSQNKLLARLNGKPLVARAVETALASNADEVLVVTGHEAVAVRDALSDYDIKFVHCADAAKGLARSLNAGLAALDNSVSGAVICLGDMPYVRPNGINALIDAYDPDAGHTIIVTTHEGKRGNPVLWDKRYFAEMSRISGDVGARHLIGLYEEAVLEVTADDASKLVDIDTPEALATARAQPAELDTAG